MNDNMGKIFTCGGKIYEIDKHPFPFIPGEVLTGDIYEVLRAIDGKLLFYKDHIQRFTKSIELSGLQYDFNKEKFKKDLIQLVKAEGNLNRNIKIVLARREGVLYLYAYLNKYYYPAENQYIEGVKTDFVEIERQNPNIKAFNENYKKAVNKAMEEKDLFEVILVNSSGYVTEGSRTNIFAIQGSKIYTAPAAMVLEGITRKYVIQACREAGFVVVEQAMEKAEILACDGVFLSGTSIKTLPVKSIGGREFNTGNNEVFQQVRRAYEKIMQNGLEG